jgi:poly(3-hydroxybutyrate) depolymerase
MPQFLRQAILWWWAIGLAAAWLLLGSSCQKQATAPQQQQQQTSLPALGAELNATSVSGISSGAYMAGQFQMAHAKLVTGAAIIAGGPYGCSESVFADSMPGPGTAFLNLSKAVNGCMLDLLGIWGVADPAALADKAKARAEKGEIDPLADIVKDRVYLFSGTSDRTVVPSIVTHAAEFYAKLGLPEANIKFVHTLPAGHAFVTDSEGGACERSGEPYVVDCDYDQAGELLQHIYGSLNPHSIALQGSFTQFDQRPYHSGQMPDGMADNGVVYVPKPCAENSGCRIHVAFHGCAQNREAVGDAFIKESGFARWADTNKLIILFPQVATTVSNPQGCWDWWGYTGHDYLTRKAPQIKAVRAMIQALHQRPQS